MGWDGTDDSPPYLMPQLPPFFLQVHHGNVCVDQPAPHWVPCDCPSVLSQGSATELNPLDLVDWSHCLDFPPVVGSGTSFLQSSQHCSLWDSSCCGNSLASVPFLLRARTLTFAETLGGVLFWPPEPDFLMRVPVSCSFLSCLPMNWLRVFYPINPRSTGW